MTTWAPSISATTSRAPALGRAVDTDDLHVADNESTAGWFEADALPTPLMKSSHARIAHAMAYRSHPENGIWFARR